MADFGKPDVPLVDCNKKLAQPSFSYLLMGFWNISKSFPRLESLQTPGWFRFEEPRLVVESTYHMSSWGIVWIINLYPVRFPVS